MPPLKNLQHEQFIQLYFADPEKNIVKAYLGAGYKCKSAKDNSNSANVTAGKLLKTAAVQRRLSELTARQIRRMDISADRTLVEMMRIGFSDVRNIIGRDGAITDPRTWTDETAAAIAGLETEKLFEGTGKDRKHIGYTQKVKLWDKNRALENLAKHLRLLHDPSTLSGLFAGANVQVNMYLPEKSAHVISNGHAAIDNGSNGHTE